MLSAAIPDPPKQNGIVSPDPGSFASWGYGEANR